MRAGKLLGIAVAAIAAVGAAIGVGAASSSCASTPTNIPVRTFDRAQKVDVVCLNVNDSSGNALSGIPAGGGVSGITPLPESECAPVPSTVFGPSLPNHLFAVVTQATRGELAVVDLTGGYVVDEDDSTPGTNFIPVGANPTDVAVAPDAAFTYVASADPNQLAIYAIDNSRLLGTSTAAPKNPPLKLTDLNACSLPQPPRALAIAPQAGGDYVVLAMLRAWSGIPARIVAIGSVNGKTGSWAGGLAPCPISGATGLSGALPPSWTAGPTWPDGVPYVDGGVGDLSAVEPPLGATCAAPAATEAGAGDAAPMDAGDAAPADGAPADAAPADGAPADAAPADAALADAESVDAGTAEAGPADAGDAGMALAFGPLDDPHPSSMVYRSDAHLLYVGDDAVPLIHVIDVSNTAAPREQEPLLATSVLTPGRRVSVGAIALSPATHDYRRYLYAVDAKDGSLMVYDVTSPATSPRTPLRRPHAELNPLLPPDRLSFAAPVVSVAFVQHDWPLVPSNISPKCDSKHAFQGLICNPNPNAAPVGSDPCHATPDYGAYYRADMVGVILPQATTVSIPSRLRGIFAFATLSSGQVVTIDVDDWDAPCRRPDPMVGTTDAGPGTITGVLDVPQPDAGPDDLDPYHAPNTFVPSLNSAAVTLESFFPVSAPNRTRSNYLLRNDPVTGQHIPHVLGSPQLFDLNGAPVSTTGTNAGTAPLMVATRLPPGWIDPSFETDPTNPLPSTRQPPLDFPAVAFVPNATSQPLPSVRISYDDPSVHQDQDWIVVYEGTLPTVSGIVATIAPDKDNSYGTLTLIVGDPNADAGAEAGAEAGGVATGAASGVGLCARGIEDHAIGQARAAQALSAMKQAGLAQPASLASWTSDYVELTDDLPPQGDPYWSQRGNECWQSLGLDNDDADGIADKRFQTCQQSYDAASDADTHLARDFPILEAYDDHLVVGRFGWQPTNIDNTPVNEQTTNRVVVGPDPSNAPFLRLARCCFHHQGNFKVRAGGEWLAIGQNGIGMLHHVTVDPSDHNRCVLSCDPRQALLNARSFDVPWGDPNAACAAPSAAPSIDRNSVLAMRNPFFSYVVWSGCGKLGFGDHTLTARDLNWRFSLRGGFAPLTVSITGGTTTAVSPQSMRFIDSLGLLAVVDGEAQGLVLIDLNTITFAHNPYY
jgi:hypothetical protein